MAQRPMKNKIHYAPEARRDMDEIWDYIATELQSIAAAKRTVDRILNTVDQLENFAELGAPLASICAVVSDYRFLVSGNYMIFYRVEGSDVHVDRVTYGRRDYLRLLFGDVLEEEPAE